MKAFLKLTLVVAVLLGSGAAHSYDLDTHFYGTYVKARFAGIRHEVALKIATATQWMDESYISDPVSMILLPDVGIKKRRLLHFPASRLASKLTISQLPSFLDPSSGVKLKTFTETEADHEFATEMFTEGLREGNLMKVAAGLHTLQDSFAHAGTISELGHAHFWHHPDRPFVDMQSVEKYFKMSRSVLRAMVAIRTLLPASAVDMNLKYGDIPNYQLNGDRLADIYENLPDVRATVSRQILKDPRYVRFALENVFKRANQVKYVANGYEPYLNNFTVGQDTYEAAASVVKSLPPQMIDLRTVMKDTGYPAELSSEYILSMGGLSTFLNRAVMNLLSGIVPRPLDAYHRFEKEEDGPIWIKELDLRVANMRAMVHRMFQRDIFFVANNTNNERGFLKEMTQDPIANPRFPRRQNPNTQLVTYDLNEKKEFNTMVFAFLFPKTSDYLKEDMDKGLQFIASANQMLKSDRSYFSRFTGTVGLMLDSVSFGSRVSFRQTIRNAHEDIYRARLVPNSTNRYYVVPSLLQKQVRTGEFKPLLTNQEVDQLLYP